MRCARAVRNVGVRVPARVVETARGGFVHLVCHQDAMKVVISLAILYSDSPPHCSPSPRSRSRVWLTGSLRESQLTIGRCACAVQKGPLSLRSTVQVMVGG